jgi:Tetratricopeptide repeat
MRPPIRREHLPLSGRALRLQTLDRLLAHDPQALHALAERAGLLREDGRFEDAKRDYLAVLQQRPTDFAALNDFGTLVLNAGYREAARSLFGAAVAHHPDNPTGRVNLANLLLALGEFAEARGHFEAALRADPDHAHAHRGLGNLLAASGDEAGAQLHRDKGFRNRYLSALPYRGKGEPILVLLLVSALGGNIPTSTILDDRLFRTTVLVSEYADANAPLPAHDLFFNSIGDADLCADGLNAACALVARSNAPVINHPAKVRRSGRAANVERLRGLPDVVVPRMAKVARRCLVGAEGCNIVADNGFSFPLLVRAPGFHTGQHFVRVEEPAALAAAVADFPGEDVWLIEQLDARDEDGHYRKLRVMIVGGRLYPLHLAISRNWKVHYFRADMAHSAENRGKDAAFLADMAGFVGRRGVAALERIMTTLDLDYGGIDFAVNSRGEILLFEANATMVMIPLAADEKWDYRRAAFDNVFVAIRAMLLRRVSLQRANVVAAASA